jgi:hypothetical protein
MEHISWRQAYYNTEGTLIPAKPISRSNIDYEDCILKLKRSFPNHTKDIDRHVTFFGLQAYTTEDDANKEPFNINKHETY